MCSTELLVFIGLKGGSWCFNVPGVLLLLLCSFGANINVIYIFKTVVTTNCIYIFMLVVAFLINIGISIPRGSLRRRG